MKALFYIAAAVFVLYYLGIAIIDLTGLFNWLDSLQQVRP